MRIICILFLLLLTTPSLAQQTLKKKNVEIDKYQIQNHNNKTFKSVSSSATESIIVNNYASNTNFENNQFELTDLSNNDFSNLIVYQKPYTFNFSWLDSGQYYLTLHHKKKKIVIQIIKD